VRHPLYIGWLLMFWAAPKMTVAHLVFALVTTAYIIVAIQFEERDLARVHPEYVAYKESVPMFVPVGSSKQKEPVVVRQASARRVS
jgi:protein-S-isoprenylcysteine O-methyltransferase Ste14